MASIHYVEAFQTWTPSTKNTWEEKDLSAFIPTTGNITAEIVIGTSGNVDINYSGGVRTPGSSLERLAILNYARNSEGYNTVTMHVKASNGKIENFAPSGIDFFLMGYWEGAKYVELIDNFLASGTNSWTNGNLNGFGVPSGAIAEIAASQSFGNLTQGFRSVGSSDDRRFVMDKGDNNATPDNYAFWSSPIQTSGNLATIQHYVEFASDWQPFQVFGYWEVPPGNFTDIYTDDAANPPNELTWDDVVATGLPSGSIGSFLIGHEDVLNSRVVGIRESGSSLERKINSRKISSERCMISCHVNALDGNIETIAENVIGTNDHFVLIGYWDDLAVIPVTLATSGDLYTQGLGFESGITPLFTHGLDLIDSSGQYPSGVPFFIQGVQLADFDLNIHGKDNLDASGDLFVFGVNVFRTDSEFSINYPSGLSIFTTGSGIIPESGQTTLFLIGRESVDISGDMFTEGSDSIQISGDLFIKVPEPFSNQMTLYLHKPISPGSGLIGGTDAIFYLSRRHHDDTNLALERVENINWDVPSILFGNRTFLDQSGAVITVGDGTLPNYNDMGGGFSSSQFGSALVGDVPQQQNIVGNVLSPQDYPYVGSGSITTAFWMSGAKTSGNIIEAGWFFRSGPTTSIGNADNDHTVGIKITDGNSIRVRTSVRDLPYDQLTPTGLWWGGTTHYGTPTGTNWTWRTSNEYWAWDEEWPEVTVAHDDTAFFMVRSEFVASGIEIGVPDHMKVWLSVDGQPWIFIGSGITGPPASSLFSVSTPRNRHAENTVGLKVQAINNDFHGESLAVNEIVLWTDSNKLDSDELNTFYNIVPTNFRPLDEYKPTIVPTTTYIHRTIGPFTLPPIAQEEGFNPGEIGSGLLVTLEVGIGDYGEDASAYLLEETPPSGFIINNIHPGFDIRYAGQGSRPNTQQQIFHDPQSGIIQPYNEALGVNTHGASIRWINHDNHPQKDERRLPIPTGIYTYELYPFAQDGAPAIEVFTFSGSGLFFDGTNGSGTFSVETTVDISGTASGVLGGLRSSAIDLFISGPVLSSGTINLYIRTIEKFTSAFIGNAPRTPEAIDFIFESDGAASIESLAGFEYGPALYAKGPLPLDNNITLVLFAPEGDEITLFAHGSEFFTSSGDFPSGMLLRIGDGHEVISGSINLFTTGPIPFSGQATLYTQAGAFDERTLFTHGHISQISVASGYIKGPEFIITSGDFPYPLDETLFTFPSGGNSPDLYMKGPEFIISSGTFPYPGDSSLFTTPSGGQSPDLYMQAHIEVNGNVPLWIGPLREKANWTLYLKSVSNTISGISNLFIHGFIGASGVNQAFNEMPFFLEASNADFPYTVGGMEEWTLFIKVQSGNITIDEDWSLFLKADTTTTGTLPLFTFGHASGQPPHGNEINDSINMVCSVDPDDLSRIGFIPHDSHDDPWILFIKGNPGHFGITNLYISGSAPVNLIASGNLFIEGLFEQETATATLYLLGISGTINNGPNGVPLFINVGAQVYNNRANLYAHGF